MTPKGPAEMSKPKKKRRTMAEIQRAKQERESRLIRDVKIREGSKQK